MISAGNAEKQTALRLAFFLGGGKAFGLMLCEMIAAHDDRLCVPTWHVIDSIMQNDIVRLGQRPVWLSEKFGNSRVILRSSDAREDWMDGAAGRFESCVASPESVPVKLAKAWVSGYPVVIQRHIEGIGIVVDIAHSQLLNQAIVRTATGRDYTRLDQECYTTATYDSEGLMRAWDLNGKPLTATHHGLLLGKKVWNLPLHHMVKALVNAVSSIGLTFGLQLELVVHPDEPDVWHLVQVRPSPEQVRGTARTPQGSPCITTTPVVNRSFDVYAPIVDVRKEDIHQIMKLAVDFPDIHILDLITRYTGRIVLWSHEPPEDYRLHAAHGLGRLGVVAQVSNGIIRVNTTHQSIRPEDATRDLLWRITNDESAILGIDAPAFEVLRKFCKSTETNLHMVSDGLVGQIFVGEKYTRRT